MPDESENWISMLRFVANDKNVLLLYVVTMFMRLVWIWHQCKQHKQMVFITQFSILRCIQLCIIPIQ